MHVSPGKSFADKWILTRRIQEADNFAIGNPLQTRPRPGVVRVGRPSSSRFRHQRSFRVLRVYMHTYASIRAECRKEVDHTSILTAARREKSQRRRRERKRGGSGVVARKMASTAGKSLLELTPETELYEEIQRTLFRIQEKLANEKSRKMDKEVLRLLNDTFNLLDQGADDDEKDGTEDNEDTNEDTNTTMVKSDNEPAGPNATNEMAEEMADEAEDFADYRADWEYAWSKTCGPFEYKTALSSMQFTYYTPGRNPRNSPASTHTTLQIYSIKLAEIAGGLEWPLSVYGVVAVRDPVDHNRNFLFHCDRDNSQELTPNDPFLRLIGPSRAVVYTHEINYEMELKVKGTTESEDKALITVGRHRLEVFGHDVVSTVCFENCFCTMELRAQVVSRTTQATILGVQVEAGQWPFKYGARVACSSLAGQVVVTEDNRVTFVTSPSPGEIVMVDSKDGAILKGGGGYLHLPRSVISVEDQGSLDVEIQAYSKSGGIAARCHVSFPAKFSKITRKSCSLGGVKLVVTIAWSQVARDKNDVMALGCFL